MANQKKHNNKIPPSPFEGEQHGQEGEERYADCFYEWETCLAGTNKCKYRDPNKHQNMFDSYADPTGAIHSSEVHEGNTIHTESYPGHHRYWTSSSSDHIGGHKESVAWNGTHNSQSQHEGAQTTAGQRNLGVAKTNIRVAKTHGDVQTAASGQTGGSSDIDASSNSQRGFDDNGVLRGNHHDQQAHTNYKDAYHIFSGNHGVYVRKSSGGSGGGDSGGGGSGGGGSGGGGGGGAGNHDTYAEGKFQIRSDKEMYQNTASEMKTTSGKDMTIESKTKITIKVGGSSITLESGTITIKSAQVKFEKG